jgi:hypothetical protein
MEEEMNPCEFIRKGHPLIKDTLIRMCTLQGTLYERILNLVDIYNLTLTETFNLFHVPLQESDFAFIMRIQDMLLNYILDLNRIFLNQMSRQLRQLPPRGRDLVPMLSTEEKDRFLDDPIADINPIVHLIDEKDLLAIYTTDTFEVYLHLTENPNIILSPTDYARLVLMSRYLDKLYTYDDALNELLFILNINPNYHPYLLQRYNYLNEQLSYTNL